MCGTELARVDGNEGKFNWVLLDSDKHPRGAEGEKIYLAPWTGMDVCFWSADIVLRLIALEFANTCESRVTKIHAVKKQRKHERRHAESRRQILTSTCRTAAALHLRGHGEEEENMRMTKHTQCQHNQDSDATVSLSTPAPPTHPLSL